MNILIKTPKIFLTAWLVILSTVSVAGGSADVQELVVNYHQHSATLATGGALQEGAVPALQASGFARIIDVRTVAEGTAEEEQLVTAQGLAYHNIPLGRELPTAEEISTFASLMADESAGPTLVHCRSGNRVGTLWALYRAQGGAELEKAIAEGRAMGMSEGREALVRERLTGSE